MTSRTLRRPRGVVVWMTALAGLLAIGCTPPAPTATAVPGAAGPGGRGASVAPPSSPSSWRTVYLEEFTGSTIGSRWSVYSGSPSSDPWTKWESARTAVSGGALVLSGRPSSGERWTTGGVSNWRNAQTYGRWTIRYRATTSSVMSYHFLLWPKANTWPPEVDIAESWDASRRRIDGFVHWRDGTGSRQRVSAATAGDFTGWQTVAVEWTPTALTYTLNGKVWARFTGGAVPHQPMWLALQTETQICNRTSQDCSADRLTTTPRVEIDRVVVESYVG